MVCMKSFEAIGGCSAPLSPEKQARLDIGCVNLRGSHYSHVDLANEAS